MKRTHIVVASLTLVSLLASFVEAQTPATRTTPCNPATPNNAVCLSWGAVATRTDGLPTTFPVTYRVEQQNGTGAFTAIGTPTATQLYVANLVPGAYTFRVFAIENQVVSDPSNAASRSINQAPPNAPVIVIAVVIGMDKAPVYRITSSGIGSTVFGFVPTGRSCGELVTRYRGLAWHRVAIRNPERELWGTTDGNNLAAPCAATT